MSTESRLRARGRHVGALLLAAQRHFNEDLVAALHGRGFTDLRAAHGAVFANIDPEGTRATELARRAGITKQSMGELVDDLERKGYVERQGDPLDRRARIVVPTARGIAVDRDADEVIDTIERAYAEGLGADRLALLTEILEELVDARET
jgi:DNA-binding MarR family transcriptional regulator